MWHKRSLFTLKYNTIRLKRLKFVPYSFRDVNSIHSVFLAKDNTIYNASVVVISS